MNRCLYVIIILAFISLQGCAAPGSAINTISLEGEINHHPKEELSVQVTVDKHYGLGGLDEYFGEPEVYGHNDKINVLHVDDGIFTGPEIEVIYHMTFWIIPPLGGFPGTPPKPYFYLEFSNIKDEIYVVGEAKDGFDYKVFDTSAKKEIEKDTAYWKILSGKYLPIEGESPKGWKLKLGIEKYNNKAFQADSNTVRIPN